MTDIVGDGWWQDLDVSGDIPKQAMIQEAQAWLDDQGYNVQVLNCKLNDDDMEWYIEGSFQNSNFAKKGVAEGSEQRWRVTVGNKSGTLSHTKTFTGTKEQAIKQAVTRFATSRNPVVTAELVKQDVAENYPKHQDLSGISTDKLKAYLAKQGKQQGSGEGGQVKRVRTELQRREQGVAEGSDIAYHQTSGTKAGHTISSRKLSNKPQASKSDVTLQSGSMHHSGKSYNFPKGTLFTQLPGGIFAKHPSVPETHPGYGHLIRRSEDNINKIHSSLNGGQGVTEGSDNPYGYRKGQTVKLDNGQQGRVIDIFDDSIEVLLVGGRTVTVDFRDAQVIGEQGVAEGMLDNPGEQDSPVAQAIIRRILLQRTDLLAKHGPEKVGQAVDEVADFVGDVDEIGSSDVSGWVRHVEQMLGNMEQDVAEVSKATLDLYVPKAVDAHGHADFSARASKDDPTKRSYHVDQKKTAEKRRQGISRALDRMSRSQGVAEGMDTLNVGDEVIITGAVKYKGATGVVDSVGRDGNFIVVNLYNHGKQSFQSADVSYNDYAGSEAEQSEIQQRGLGESAPRSALGKAIREGAKVDRMVKHIAKSERSAGKSKDEAEDIAWATANKRGMLDNKNKKTESTKVRTSKKY